MIECCIRHKIREVQFDRRINLLQIGSNRCTLRFGLVILKGLFIFCLHDVCVPPFFFPHHICVAFDAKSLISDISALSNFHFDASWWLGLTISRICHGPNNCFSKLKLYYLVKVYINNI